jgi:hypothetical protein
LVSLKNQKELIKENYEMNLKKAKDAYSKYSKSESEFIKTKSELIKTFVNKNSANKQSEVSKINEQITKNKTLENKLQKREKRVQLFMKKQDIKEQALNNFVEFQTELRKSFVDKYNKATK